MQVAAKWLCKCGGENTISTQKMIDTIRGTILKIGDKFLTLILANCSYCSEKHIVIIKVQTYFEPTYEPEINNPKIVITGEIMLILSKDDYENMEDLIRKQE